MRDPQPPQPVRLADYRVPAFLVDRVELFFDIHDGHTQVDAVLDLRRNPAAGLPGEPLQLDGEELETLLVAIDGRELGAGDYAIAGGRLRIPGVPDAFRLQTRVRIHPARNTALEGLYMSHGMYCTQCEAEGFRRITWYPDRPDVMARFRTTIEADAARYPLLLSNGNLVQREALAGGRHRAVWEDPFPKPCYLFALVAADLACHEDSYRTASGRAVKLQLFVEPHDLDKTAHAMASLKAAMRWDEEVYGLEYDLDTYMIVAVSHFNMGAMENKGLNVFNTSCVLANHRTQTDKAFQRVEAVVAHEYFHNWSGNRVTCRDWFQLSLKEGFTVFRDAEFSKDMNSRAVKRIEEVNFLRSVQFPEDAGPMAHPVRPDSYLEINNFYTVTIYEKGAEVVRMLQTLLGREGFRRGTDLYFRRHDGQAVTTEDFVRAMEDANGVDLALFRRWYVQAGTPRVEAGDHYDPSTGDYTLVLRQSCPPTPGQPHKEPFLVPVVAGLLSRDDGRELCPAELPPGVRRHEHGLLLELSQAEQSYCFRGLGQRPLPSLLRGFSAPVDLACSLDDAELAFLAAHDSDGVNRWNAAQQLFLRHLLAQAASPVPEAPASVVALFRDALAREGEDPAFLAELLQLPGETYIADHMAVADPEAAWRVRTAFRAQLAGALGPLLRARWQAMSPAGSWSPAPAEVGRRALRNLLLDFLAAGGGADVAAMAAAQFRGADNMTDQLAALRVAVHGGLPGADDLLGDFLDQWKHEALVVDQWFSLQATVAEEGALARVEALLAHPLFELTNPNRVRALVGAFANGNPRQFHRADGAGYAFLATQLLALDALNPQVAARMAGAYGRWRRLDEGRQAKVREQLDRLLAKPLSPNLLEVIGKTRG